MKSGTPARRRPPRSPYSSTSCTAICTAPTSFDPQDVASWIRDLEVRTLVAVADQELVGWAEASAGRDLQPTWWLDVLVPPQERQREITERLVREAEDIARTASPDGVEAKFYLPEADARLRAVVSERGYRPMSYSFRLERLLESPAGERRVA